ncbi:MAG: ATP citrate lyase citrate-binding domain-containing protein [Candidatus Saccharimonadales bacterium]
MPRQKLSEYRAKKILAEVLENPYQGWQIDAEKPLAPQLDLVPSEISTFVVKVDEAVKGRFKKGLVLLNITRDGLAEAVQNLTSKGYKWLIIEPVIEHKPEDERYFSLTMDRQGKTLSFSPKGGVEIENNQDSISHIKLKDDEDESSLATFAKQSGLGPEVVQKLVNLFTKDYFSFLEINPFLLNEDKLTLLDAAIEVDDAGTFFVRDWTSEDFRRHSDEALTQQEKTVLELDENSPASFKLSVLEPNGSIFLLLSGGGASVVVADEIYNQGFGEQLGNYGEYSGNPNTEETYIYTKGLLELLLASNSPKKVLFIGGAVANFTDVAKTFSGVIQAIKEVMDKLKQQGVKVYVRRGGPNQEVGLAKIEAVLKENGLLGAVHGPDVPLTKAVAEALEEIK